MVTKPGITVTVNCEELDIAIEKANQLMELLTEVHRLIDSLQGKVDRTA